MYCIPQDPWTGSWLLQKHRKSVVPQKHHLMLPESIDSDHEKREMPPITARPCLEMVMSDEVPFASTEALMMTTEHYKFRKIGDRKIVGCQIDSRRLVITGWLNKSDFKKATLKAKTGKKGKDSRQYQCQLIAPKGTDDPLRMKIKWEHLKIGAAASRSGVTKLFKLDTLDDDDDDLPAADFVGFCRHEFFDALLCVVRLEDSKRALYSLFNDLVINHLNAFIFKSMVDLRQYLQRGKIDSELHDRLHSDSSVIRLHSRYASLQKETENLEEDEWCAMAEDMYIVAKSMDKDIWKFGGKPSEKQLIQCFRLSKPAKNLDEEWLGLSEFIRCLIYFTAALFKDQPNAKYQVLPFKEKLDLVLKWCCKMDAQHKTARPMHFRSNSLRMIRKRRNSDLSLMRPPSSSFMTSCTPRSSTGSKKGALSQLSKSSMIIQCNANSDSRSPSSSMESSESLAGYDIPMLRDTHQSNASCSSITSASATPSIPSPSPFCVENIPSSTAKRHNM